MFLNRGSSCPAPGRILRCDSAAIFFSDWCNRHVIAAKARSGIGMTPDFTLHALQWRAALLNCSVGYFTLQPPRSLAGQYEQPGDRRGAAYYHRPTGATEGGRFVPGLVSLDLASGTTASVTPIDSRAAEYILSPNNTLTTLDAWGRATSVVNLSTGEVITAAANGAGAQSTARVGNGTRVLVNSLAVDKAGKNLSATSNIGFYRISVAIGDRKLLAPMNCTEACEVELNGDHAYIIKTEGGRKAAYKADLLTGLKTLVSSVNRRSGEVPARAVGMTLDTRHDRLILAEFWGISSDCNSLGEDYGLVMEVDLADGDRKNFWWDAESGGLNDALMGPGPLDVWLNNASGCFYMWAATLNVTLMIVQTRESSLPSTMNIHIYAE